MNIIDNEKSFYDFTEGNCEYECSNIEQVSMMHIPTKIGMKKHEGGKGVITNNWYEDKSYVKQHSLYRYIPKLLKKNIGKPFGDVYSKFCCTYPEYIGTTNTRNEFKEWFINFDNHIRYYQNRKHFVIDENGLIQYYKPDKTKNMETYMLNKPFLKKHFIIDSCLYEVLGESIYNECFNNECISPKLFNEIKKLFLENDLNALKMIKAFNDEDYENHDFFDTIFIKSHSN